MNQLNFIHIGDKYVTCSAIVPVLKLLSDDVLKEKDDSTLTNDIRSYILADLSQRNLETARLLNFYKYHPSWTHDSS